MINSKCHKNDEKNTQVAVHISPSAFGIKKNTVHPDTFIECNSVVIPLLPIV